MSQKPIKKNSEWEGRRTTVSNDAGRASKVTTENDPSTCKKVVTSECEKSNGGGKKD